MLKKLTTEEFVKKANLIHNNKYRYLSIYCGMSVKMQINCSVHGDFWQRAGDHIYNKTGCPQCGICKNTNKKRLTLQEFIERSNLIHNFQYDYSRAIYVDYATKIEIGCNKHGYFYQNPNSHLNGNGCPECGNLKISKKLSSNLDEFIIKANLIHNDRYDYSESIYTGNKREMIIKCYEHGRFYQTPNMHLNGHGCQECGKIIK
ncbi:MAG TPA: hypothetical protein VHZ50_10455, partial [Puia sp.]|nr:hypothetical protein [Puia sp.]